MLIVLSVCPACIPASSGKAKEVRRELLAEAKKHPTRKRLCQIPSIGPIRAAVLMGILQTPYRFRTKRQLWAYSGVGIETHSGADHRSVDGQLQRAKKQSSIRGLNRNCNHDLKNLFKSAAIVASSKPGPFQEFYTALLTRVAAGLLSLPLRLHQLLPRRFANPAAAQKLL
jgi:hypothetical protein